MSDAAASTLDSSEENRSLRAFADEASRRPVLLLLVSAAAWLLVASVLGFLASVKGHASDLFATSDLAFLHYGRLKPAFQTAFLYGWCFTAGLGVSYWIMARLCKTGIKKRHWILWGIFLWNILVTVAVLSILLGGSTSYEWLAFPDWLWVPMLVAFLLIAVAPVILYQIRRPGTSFVSQLYILGACLWFPVLFLGANFAIRHAGAIGVMGPATNSWYVSGVLFLFLVPMGLASAYYMIPKITGRPIHSYQLARLGFWSLALFGGWSGMQRYLGGPLPTWITAIAAVAGILLLIPVVVVAVNHHQSTKGSHARMVDSPTMRFTVFGGFCFTAFGVLSFLLSMLWSGKTFQFGFAQEGLQMLGAYGFFTMVMFGAFYFILPRLSACEWPSARLINLHFLLSMWGVLFMISMMLFGGMLQGQGANMKYQPAADALYTDGETDPNSPQIPGRPEGYVNWERDHYQATSYTAWTRRGVSFTWLLLSGANLVFFVHVILMALRLGRKSPEPTLLGHAHAPTAPQVSGGAAH